MKWTSFRYMVLAAIIAWPSADHLKAQTVEELMDLLVQKQVIQQQEADSIRAEIALKAQQEKENQNKFSLISGKPLQISGYTQARFQSFQEDNKNDGVDLRRIRLDFKGPVTSSWDYRLQVDFASSVRVIDAYVNVALDDYLKITVGQQKIPFSSENLADDSKLETIDRSQAAEALTSRGGDVIGNHNGRDIGVLFGGSLFEDNNQYLIDYSLGVFNGAGINSTDNNKQKDFSGRIILHPVKGIDIGGSYYNGYDRWGSGTAAKDQPRKRYGAELKIIYQAASFSAEYISGQDGNTVKNGAYAQLGYFLIPKTLQPVVKFDRFNSDVSTTKGISTVYTIGANYFFNDWAKLQANYLLRKEKDVQINNDIVELQLQLSF